MSNISKEFFDELETAFEMEHHEYCKHDNQPHHTELTPSNYSVDTYIVERTREVARKLAES